MENIVQIQTIISAFIALVSAIIVAILSGIFQLRIAKRDREIQEKQLKESKDQFSAQMEQFLEEQRNAIVEKANDKLQAETKRFYESLIEEMIFYNRLLNELHYLNNITNPKGKEFRVNGAYPYIDNNVKDLIGNVSLPPDIAKLLGALRANISIYNSALQRGADSEILEEALGRVYSLIDPINKERFENFSQAQIGLRKHEIDIAKWIIQK